jgi:hypothetical protein
VHPVDVFVLHPSNKTKIPVVKATIEFSATLYRKILEKTQLNTTKQILS